MNTMRKYITDQFVNPERNGGYGAGLKRDVRRLFGSTLGMSGRGESIPQYSNYCEIDPATVDQFGIPVLKFHYQWTDQEVRQAKHMHDTFEDILTNMGATLLGSKPGLESNYGLAAPGRIIHEVGTTRMGNNPNTSVLNKHSQAHDCKNLFVVDAGPFVSQADKNPTWTILALAWRASDYIVDQLKKQNI
jgi:choline dehydrogenase-like flavoprotein